MDIATHNFMVTQAMQREFNCGIDGWRKKIKDVVLS